MFVSATWAKAWQVQVRYICHNMKQQSRPPGHKTGDLSPCGLACLSRHQLRKSWCRPQCVRGLQHPKEVQYDEYDGDNDQNVYPISGARETWNDPPAEKAKQPQDEQNYDDGPQHEILLLNDLSESYPALSLGGS
jgi:hypothetical protein